MHTDEIETPLQASKKEFKPYTPRNTGVGGWRAGAGKKKGSKNLKTLLREEAVRELTEKAAIKAEILSILPPSLRRSEKALQQAIKEIQNEDVEKLFKQRVAMHSSRLATALLTAAMGEQFLYKVIHFFDDRGKSMKRHVKVTDPEEISAYLDNPLEVEGSDYFYISTKSPDINAINSLLDRFMGKPATKIVGPNNPDGSEGPIKIITVNYSPKTRVQAPDYSYQLVGETINNIIEEENGN